MSAIVTINASFSFGSYPIMKFSIKHYVCLDSNEANVANNGYTEQKRTLNKFLADEEFLLQLCFRARHGTTNKRLKNFCVCWHLSYNTKSTSICLVFMPIADRCCVVVVVGQALSILRESMVVRLVYGSVTIP